MDGPANEVSQSDRKEWVRALGCVLGQSCPRSYCIHVQGIAGLVEYVMKLFRDLKERTGPNLNLKDILRYRTLKLRNS